MNTNTTIVTGLWDLGRENLQGWAKRSFNDYKDKFFELLESDNQMCIWIPNDLEEEVRKIRGKKPTKIFIKNVEDFKKWNPFFDKIQNIRNNPKWRNFAGWLEDSPQAALEYYNPMMFTKMFMLNDSALVNPFESEYFFWVDGGLTNTVDKGYFTNDKVFDNLSNFVLKKESKFIQIAYPYEINEEIHGFERKSMARYCHVDYVKLISRGGFFGGDKEKIHQINSLYYNIMESTLNEGLMGADECLFTILAHRHSDLIYRFEIESNGLVWPFFEELKKYTKEYIRADKNILDKNNVALYVITFNSPKQFKSLIESMLEYDKNFIEKTKKFLLDNSTDDSTTPEYKKLCVQYGFEHIKKNNIGIVGGRVFVAEHFQESDFDYYFWFEDDMFLSKEKNKTCRNGFNRYVANLYDKSLEIIKKENYDFLKLSFSEFYGDNSVQWSWYNVPQDFREKIWPEKPFLPVRGLDPNSPKTKFKNIKSHKNLPYADGEIYLCNWPSVFDKKGNFKCYLETKFEYPQEQTLMSQCYKKTLEGTINPAVLLLSPIEHDRFDHYAKELRKES